MSFGAAAPLQPLTLEKLLGQRRDGRNGTVMRPMEVRWGELSQADGSTWFTQGNTAVLATIVGPTAAKTHQEDYNKAFVEVLLNRAQPALPNCGGASKSVADQKKTKQLQCDSKLQGELTRVFQSIVMAEKYPRCVVTISLNILKDDGSLVAACANAAMCALLNAGIYCRATVCGVSVTKWKRAKTVEGTAAADGGSSSSSSNNVEQTLWLDTTKDEETAARREARIFSAEESSCGLQALNDKTPILAIDASFVLCHPPLDGVNSVVASFINSSVVSSPKVASATANNTTSSDSSSDNAASASSNVFPNTPSCTFQDIQQLMKVAERCCLSTQGGVIEFIRGVMNPNNLITAAAAAAAETAAEASEKDDAN